MTDAPIDTNALAGEEVALLRAALRRAMGALKVAEEIISHKAELNALADIRATIISIEDTPGYRNGPSP